MLDVPSSRFLRPVNPKRWFLDRQRLARITSAMAQAARLGTVFHLWWHPPNFGNDTAENAESLRQLIAAFHRLADEHGMTAATTSEVAHSATKNSRSTHPAPLRPHATSTQSSRTDRPPPRLQPSHPNPVRQ